MKSANRKIVRRPAHVLCTDAGEYRIDLHFGRVYRVVKGRPNDPPQYLRIIDESGEDYLYPRSWFVPVELPPKARRALAAA